MYQIQAAAAVGGKGLNMPRGAAVKPVSRFQGPNKHIQAADMAVTSRLAPPSPPRAAARGNLTTPGERRGGGESCFCSRDNYGQHERTRAAVASFTRQPQHHNSICRCLVIETFSGGGKKRTALKLKSVKLAVFYYFLLFNKCQSGRPGLASISRSGEFDLPSGKAAEFFFFF